MSHTHPRALQGTVCELLFYAQLSCPDFTYLVSLFLSSAHSVTGHSVLWRRQLSTPQILPSNPAFWSHFHISHLIFSAMASETTSPSDWIPGCSSICVYFILLKVAGSSVMIFRSCLQVHRLSSFLIFKSMFWIPSQGEFDYIVYLFFPHLSFRKTINSFGC